MSKRTTRLGFVCLEDRTVPAPLAITLDPAQSKLTLGATIPNFTFGQQGTGSLVTSYSGNLTADYDPTAKTIQFFNDFSHFDAAVSGNWRTRANPVMVSMKSVTRVGSTVTVVTDTPHNFQTGYEVWIDRYTGSGSGINGSRTVTGVPTSTSFTYTNSTAPNVDETSIGDTYCARAGAEPADYGGSITSILNLFGSLKVALRDLVAGMSSQTLDVALDGTFPSKQNIHIKQGFLDYGEGNGLLGAQANTGRGDLSDVLGPNSAANGKITNTSGNNYTLNLPVAGVFTLDFSGTTVTLTITGTLVGSGTLTPNNRPTITSPNAFTVSENQTNIGFVMANDLDMEQTLTLSIVGGHDKNLFQIHPTTGALSFNKAPDFENPANLAGDNKYEIVVEASDGVLFGTARQTVTITVTDVNEAPVASDRNYSTPQNKMLSIPAATGLRQNTFDPESKTQKGLYFEDFEELGYQPFPTGVIGSNGVDDWSVILPAGWALDNGSTPPPGSTTGSNIYYGWRGLNIDSWIAQQSNEARDLFTLAGPTSGNKILVIDADAYDDFTNIDPNLLDSYVSTGAVAIPAGALPGSLNFSFASDYRQKLSEAGKIEVSYDSGSTWSTLDTLTTNRRNVRESFTLPPGADTLAQFKFSYENAGDSWYWAIDDLRLSATYDLGAPLTLAHTQPANGLVSVNLTTGAFDYIPLPGFAGIDTFTYTLDDGVNKTTKTVSINVESSGATVTSLVVNSGDPQRSRLVSVQVNFSAPVNAATLAPTFTRTAGGPATIVDGNTGLIVSPASGTVSSITLTFANVVNAGIENGSLADGRWQLAIPSLGYTSPLNDPNLRRLFGDVNADGTVDGSDFAALGTAFGGTSVAFDFDANGTVDGSDFAAFGARFGLTL